MRQCARGRFGRLGPSSKSATGRHFSDLRAQSPISMRQYIANEGSEHAAVGMIDVRCFEVMRIEGRKAETVDASGQRHLTRVGG